MDSNKKEGKGEMTKAPICLQDLRRSLYVKAKAEPTWRFCSCLGHRRPLTRTSIRSLGHYTLALPTSGLLGSQQDFAFR
jgi:hypothetical protein